MEWEGLPGTNESSRRGRVFNPFDFEHPGDLRTPLAEIDRTGGQPERAVEGSGAEQLDRVLGRERKELFVSVALEQRPPRGPCGVAVEQRPDDSSVQDAGKGLVPPRPRFRGSLRSPKPQRLPIRSFPTPLSGHLAVQVIA